MNSFQYHLKDTMEMNRQKKQEEISELKQRNIQLMELLNQLEFHSTLLNDFPPVMDPPSALPFTLHSDSYSWITQSCDQHSSTASQPSWLDSLLNHTPPQEEEDQCSHTILSGHTGTGVKRKLWPGDTHESSKEDKKQQLDPEVCPDHRSSEHPESEMTQVHGSFRNYRVLKATPYLTSNPWREGKCAVFQTSIREHWTVRTGVFPHGKTFTSHTDDGGCRFLWIPKQD